MLIKNDMLNKKKAVENNSSGKKSEIDNHI